MTLTTTALFISEHGLDIQMQQGEDIITIDPEDVDMLSTRLAKVASGIVARTRIMRELQKMEPLIREIMIASINSHTFINAEEE